jgi:hypothetical protein
MPMDAWRDGEQIVVQFDLPGVDMYSVELDAPRNMLTVRAERRPSTGEDTEMIAAERPRGVLRRQLILGDTPDTDRVQASYARSEPTRSSKSSTPAGATSSLLFATGELIQTGGPRGRGDRSRASRRRRLGRRQRAVTEAARIAGCPLWAVCPQVRQGDFGRPLPGASRHPPGVRGSSTKEHGDRRASHH